MKEVSIAGRCLLSISFVLSSSFAHFSLIAKQTEMPWQVKVSVHLKFPKGVSAKLQATLEYPSKEEHNLDQVDRSSKSLGDDRETIYEFVVKPKVASNKPPSHVILHLNALGFKDETRNTGILSYTDEKGLSTASSSLQVELTPNNLPSVRNVVSFISKRSKQEYVFEIDLFNALDFEASITRIVLGAGAPLQFAIPPEFESYEIKFRGTGRGRTAQIEEEGSRQPRSYPVEWRRDASTSHFSADMPVNLRVPAKGSAILKFHIDYADLGNPVRSAKAGRVKSFDFNLPRKRNPSTSSNRSSWWTFLFEINGELSITSDQNQH